MKRIIVETIEDKENGGWGLSISNEGGSEFINTGFIYSDESYAIRKLCKVLEGLTDDSIKA